MGALRSMTGFGRESITKDGITVKVEMKSVNHRHKEINIKLPRQLLFAEPHVRRVISESIERGKVDVYIQIEFEGLEGREVNLNRELAIALWNEVKAFAKDVGVPLPNLSSIIREALEIKSEVDEEKILPIILEATEEALQKLITFRTEEGERLKLDILKRLGKLEELVDKANSIADIAIEEAKQKLMDRLKELEIDDQRIAQEIAIMLDKLDVTEELVRLQSHFKAFEETVRQGSPCGRKLDFIIQEMLREANTLGVKAASVKLSMIVVELKTEIEKIREQVQNIE
ncbi:conserved hypothetical protein [Thermosulfidibacter takaii ABI70S6]|uniref:YicC family protein n=1 Tax=Thermosulfidibacter takaii (strain DSM 17441 / JCM 13301 / NBRC 103674 / ABI70S6) TaxID=1298851 RepID=A0A0S3QRD1_THET7|nr:YicC/YloC family endoribonuclease [Thermosulfidibacter takaii]BAT70882.1 conserved hypothetical protein [Thermosulfidibacter takaii ABI70S6]